MRYKTGRTGSTPTRALGHPATADEVISSSTFHTAVSSIDGTASFHPSWHLSDHHTFFGLPFTSDGDPAHKNCKSHAIWSQGLQSIVQSSTS